MSYDKEAAGEVNKALTTISASFSLLGTFLIIATFLAWKDFRSNSRRILVYISIADFLIAGGNLLGVWLVDENNNACKAQSFISTCASLWSFFWTVFLGIYMYTAVARQRGNKADEMMKFFHIIGWGLPLVIVSVALGLGKLGQDHVDSAGWCWIDGRLNKGEKEIWMLFTGKAWEITAYFLCSIFYLMLKCRIRKEIYNEKAQFSSPQSKEAAIKAEKRLMLVPVTFILIRIWGTLRFILYTFAGVHSLNTTYGTVFLYLQGIGDSSQGFANFLLFCFFTEKFQSCLNYSVQKLSLNCKRSFTPSSMVELEISSQKTRSIQSTDERSYLMPKPDIERGP